MNYFDKYVVESRQDYDDLIKQKYIWEEYLRVTKDKPSVFAPQVQLELDSLINAIAFYKDKFGTNEN